MLDTPQRYPRAGSQSYPSPAAEPASRLFGEAVVPIADFTASGGLATGWQLPAIDLGLLLYNPKDRWCRVFMNKSDAANYYKS
jgi:hypothetical protein